MLYFAVHFAEFPNDRMLEVSVQLVDGLFSLVDITSSRYQIECFQICSRSLETASKHQSKFYRNILRQKLFSSSQTIIYKALQLSSNASESSSYQSYVVPAGRLSRVSRLACPDQHRSDEDGDVNDFYSSAVASLKGKRTAQSSQKFRVYGQAKAHDLSGEELESAISFVSAELSSSSAPREIFRHGTLAAKVSAPHSSKKQEVPKARLYFNGPGWDDDETAAKFAKTPKEIPLTKKSFRYQLLHVSLAYIEKEMFPEEDEPLRMLPETRYVSDLHDHIHEILDLLQQEEFVEYLKLPDAFLRSSIDICQNLIRILNTWKKDNFAGYERKRKLPEVLLKTEITKCKRLKELAARKWQEYGERLRQSSHTS